MTVMWQNSRILQLVAFAELVYVLHRLNSRNSLIRHPSMHAPSLARVVDEKSGRFCGAVSGEGSGRELRGEDTSRLDASLHDVIRSVPACCFPRIQGLPEYYDCSYARWSTFSNSRPVRGPEPRGETKRGRGGVLCARSGRMLGISFLFFSSCQERCM